MIRLSRASRRAVRVLAASAIGLLVLAVAELWFGQRSIVYCPRPYERGDLRQAEKIFRRVTYDLRLTSSRGAASLGRQTAFYAPPRDGSRRRPDRLWVLFGGNAAQALDWEDFVLACPDRRAAFLLIDYPGYGANPGAPTRDGIILASQAALAAARRDEGLDGDARTTATVPLGVLGHSLGCAAALELAVRERADRVVLISPFTSLLAMARRVVGWPLCELLRDRFDNAARLDELAKRSPRPAVTIFHGTDDGVVPFAMGQALAAAHKDWIAFHPVPHGDHNGVVDSALPAIFDAMLGSSVGHGRL